MAFSTFVPRMRMKRIYKNGRMTLRKLIATAIIVCSYIAQLSGQDSLTLRASYYSDVLHGWLMANGEPYHKDSMTCAHLTYRLGTVLKVRNLRNDKEVIVTVTDRGPYAEQYSLDLSRAAAEELDFIFNGFCPIQICAINPDLIPFRKEEEKWNITYELEYHPLRFYPLPVWQLDELAQQQRAFIFKLIKTKV